MTRSKQHPVGDRNGVALVIALVALMTATTVCVSLTRTMLLHQQRVERRIWRHQSDLLARSAVDFARRYLRENPDAIDAEWTVTLSGPDATEGHVRIRFEPATREDQRRVTIVAQVPVGRVERTQSTLHAWIPHHPSSP